MRLRSLQIPSKLSKFGSMSMKTLLSVSVLVLLLSMSCNKDEVPEPAESVASLRIYVDPVFAGAPLYLDSTYTTAEGYKVQFTDIKFYIQNVRNGNTTLIDAALFDFAERGHLLYSGNGKGSDFQNLQANLGVEASINHDDPSAFANSSWLNISNANDMHWGWNPGYIFVKIEGRVDTIPDSQLLFDRSIVFHCGGDAYLQSLDFTGLIWTPTGETLVEQTTWQLDMATFLQGSAQNIDLKTEFTSHSSPGQEAITLKVLENFNEALTP